jgi:hypothetical protein
VLVISQDLLTAMINDRCPHSETHVPKILSFPVIQAQIGEQNNTMLFCIANETIAFSTKNTNCTRFLSYVAFFYMQETQMFTWLRLEIV